jgi:hypothetical protein
VKRVGGLLDRIVARDNLLLAFCRARRGRRAAREVVDFAADLDGNLARMAAAIRDGTVAVGRYRTFTICDPKPRRIFAPAFAERVLQHAVFAVAGPRLERFLIDQTFACRQGFGTHAAVAKAQQYSRRWPYVLQLDVRHYFDVIDHRRLLDLLRRLWKDEAVLALVARILASYEVEPGHGLPIGALSSQHLANLYLGVFDLFVKEQLRCRGYVRYMDDMLLFGDDAASLRSWLAAARDWLQSQLGLQLKPPQVRPVRHGFDFLGIRIRPSHCTLTGARKRRWAATLKRLVQAHGAGAVDDAAFARRAGAVVAHARAVCSRGFRGHVLARLGASPALLG